MSSAKSLHSADFGPAAHASAAHAIGLGQHEPHLQASAGMGLRHLKVSFFNRRDGGLFRLGW